jgi:thiol-disulfide isomerase/thioredoxin
MATVTDGTSANDITPDDIGVDYAPRLVPDLVETTVGSDVVVIGGPTQLMVLNATAALVYQFLDGEVLLGELVADLSDALGADPDVVTSDVLDFVRELGSNGLLSGVSLPEPELDPDPGFADDWEPPTPIEVGDELDDLTLPDLDGHPVALSSFRGRRMLLVNWSPGCGFCVKIAGLLGQQAAPLAAGGVDLVLLALGDAESNRALMAEAGLEVPALLRDGTETDPFRGTGTPAAYLVDEAGRLAAEMVVGADQVPLLVEELAGVVAPVVDEQLVDGVRYLPAPAAMCGPGGGAGSGGTDWAGTRAYRLAEHHVGVRYNSEETAAVLDRLFPGAAVEDRRVPDNYSVALHLGAASKSRELNLLVEGGSQMVRSRAPSRALAGLLAFLTDDLDVDPSLLQVQATAAVGGERAMLLPAGMLQWVKQLQPRLARRGITMVDTKYARVDLETAEVVVPEPVVTHDASVLRELDEGVRLGSELPRVPPGRYPLATWFLTRSPEHRGPLPPALAVTVALPMAMWPGDLRDAVERLARLFERTVPYGLWYETVGEFVDQVSQGLT